MIAGGNVGIVTTTPSKKLTVEGDVSASNFILAPLQKMIFNNSSVGSYIFGNGANNIEIRVSNTKVISAGPTIIDLNLPVLGTNYISGSLLRSSGNVRAIGFVSASEFRTSGAITASGNISSSGNVIANIFKLNFQGGSVRPEIHRDSGTGGVIIKTNNSVSSVNNLLSLQNSSTDVLNITGDGNITASGDISASGK